MKGIFILSDILVFVAIIFFAKERVASDLSAVCIAMIALIHTFVSIIRRTIGD